MGEPVTTDAKGKSFALKVVELFSIATAVAFLAAAILNTIIFRRWQLDFMAIATPSDVVSSGLSFLISLMPVFVVSVFVHMIKSKFEKSKLFDNIVSILIFTFTLIVLLAGIFPQWSLVIPIGDFAIEYSWFWIGFALGLNTPYLFRLVEVFQTDEIEPADFIPTYETVSMAVLAIFIIGYVTIAKIDELSQDGYLGKNAVMISDGDFYQPLWIGERGILARYAGSERGIVFLAEPENGLIWMSTEALQQSMERSVQQEESKTTTPDRDEKAPARPPA